jgi:hypothetical protein
VIELPEPALTTVPEGEVGLGVGLGVGAGVGLGVGAGVGLGVGAGVGLVVGLGVGAVVVVGTGEVVPSSGDQPAEGELFPHHKFSVFYKKRGVRK